jgi:hypothetical protein
VTEIQRSGERVLEWARFVLAATVLIFVGVSVGLALPLKTVGVAFQAIGIVLTLLGVAAIGDWLQQAAQGVGQIATAGRRQVVRWRTVWIQRLRASWRRLMGDRTVHLAGISSAESFGHADVATLTVRRARVDRDSISDRDWLAFLDDRLEAVEERIDEVERRRARSETTFFIG